MSEKLLSAALNSIDNLAERLMTNPQTRGGGDPRINSTDNLFVLYRELMSCKSEIASLESRLEKAVELAKAVKGGFGGVYEAYGDAVKLADAILEQDK